MNTAIASNTRLCAPARPCSTPAVFGASVSCGIPGRWRACTSSPQRINVQQPVPGRAASHIVHAQDTEKDVKYNTEFGYSRKDVILIGVGLIALGYGLYYGLQATGMEAGYAGNWVQLIIFMGICVGWVSTYVWRVATKQMTYVKQLEQYEDAVMRKRLDELTEEEMAELVREAEQDKQRRGPR